MIRRPRGGPSGEVIKPTMSLTDEPVPLADLALARRLERAEGSGGARFVETRARLRPDSGACWIEVAGALCMYDGRESPVTQTFGLGMSQPATPADLNRIEAFFRERGAAVYHEVSPLADPTLVPLLNERGYQPFEFTSLMYRPVRCGPPRSAPRNPAVRVRLVGADEHDLWGRTAVAGWRDVVDLGESFLELMTVSAERPDARAFLAECDGKPIATGLMSMSDGVALMAGASTVPEGRRQGAQLALLDARLRCAAVHGCDVAMMGAAPGSASQRNAERQGFRIAYTRIKWRLGAPPKTDTPPADRLAGP